MSATLRCTWPMHAPGAIGETDSPWSRALRVFVDTAMTPPAETPDLARRQPAAYPSVGLSPWSQPFGNRRGFEEDICQGDVGVDCSLHKPDQHAADAVGPSAVVDRKALIDSNPLNP